MHAGQRKPRTWSDDEVNRVALNEENIQRSKNMAATEAFLELLHKHHPEQLNIRKCARSVGGVT